MTLNLLVLCDPEAPWLKLLERSLDNVNVSIAGDEAGVRREAPGAHIILNGTYTPLLLSIAVPLAPKLEWIHSLWTGVENVLSPEVLASPAPLTNGRGVFRVSLAEWAIGAMLHFAYQMRLTVRQQEEGIWQPYTTEELMGRTIGIIGYGSIGKSVAERARAFGMNILATRRHMALFGRDRWVDRAIDLSSIDELMSGSDYVVVAAPLTPETRGMVGTPQIAAMKPNAVIINIGRGAVIEEGALIEALERNRIRGAALDVFDVEPLPPGHPFYRFKNVLLSPHTADHVQDFAHLAVKCFLDNMSLFRLGRPLMNGIDKQAGY